MYMLTPIYSPEEQIERASKALRLNCDISPDYDPSLLAASSKKPTIRIKRLSFSGSNPNNIKLKGAYSLKKEERKALKLVLG